MRPLPPLYAVPAGGKRPEHVRGVAPCAFPSDVPRPYADGATYNGVCEVNLDWRECDGFKVAYRSDDLPGSTLRDYASPGQMVRGWLVPRLVGLDGVAAVGYFGPNGWTIPAKYQKPVSALLDCLDWRGDVTDAHARLAADILGLNYHVSLHELEHFEVLDRDMVRLVIHAACSVRVAEVDQA